MASRSLPTLIQECKEAFEAETILTGTRTKSMLQPPATAREIAAFEKEHGIDFPPSYRDFLLLHNGWVNYNTLFTLIGVSGTHTSKALRAVDRFTALFSKKWAAAKRPTDEAFIREYESKGKKTGKNVEAACLYIPNKLFFGSDLEVAVLFFNPSSRGRDGEMEAIHTDITWRVHGRYGTFPEMLESHLDATRKMVAAMEKNRAKRLKGR